MAKLIYAAIASLDGYVADAVGDFSWGAPGEEVLAFINQLERPIGTYLYGRGLYEVMVYWETALSGAADSELDRDFAQIWQAAEKIVYSTTLDAVSSARTRLERTFDPAAIRALKASSAQDLTVGGAALAATAMEAGLVEECHLFLVPVLVGGGKRALPGHVRLDLELLDQRRFGNGVVHLHHRIGV